MTKEEVIAAINESAATLGHVPSSPELGKLTCVKLYDIRSNFGTYTGALRACGLERQGAGYQLSVKTLFLDWATLARNLGKIPTVADYELQASYSSQPLRKRWGAWSRVPVGMLEYIRKERLEDEWGDVVEIIAKHQMLPAGRPMASKMPGNMPPGHRILVDQPMYGMPLFALPLTCAPINELGVILLFGALAQQLGFAVTRIQPEFPDCEALRQVDRERWQRVRIEFEHESRNFLLHKHDPAGCDLIVCWSHNWEGCPLEVLELKSVVRRQEIARIHG